MSELLVNAGEANAVQHSLLSLQDTTLELLGYWLAELRRQELEQQAKAKQEEAESEESESDPEFSADTLLRNLEQQAIATTTLALLEELGERDRYQAEGYTIQANQQTYSVYDSDFTEILRFERQNHELVILDDQTTAPQKQALIQVGKTLTDKGWDAIHTDPIYRSHLDHLDDFAPTGSKAAFVAHAILDQVQQDAYRSRSQEGQADLYTFQRNAQGQISIHDHYDGYEILQMQEGKIVQALSSENAEHFHQLYEQLKTRDLTPEKEVRSPEQSDLSRSPNQTDASQPSDQLHIHDRELELPAEQSPTLPSPTPAQLSEWLLASKVLGRGQEQVRHILKLGKDGSEAMGKSFLELYKDSPDQPLPLELSPKDYEQMQKDLHQFRDLVKERGNSGITAIYQTQVYSESPINITDNSQIKFTSETTHHQPRPSKSREHER